MQQRGTSVWDDFCGLPGRIRDGSSGRHACDHFNRFHDDIKLLAELGIRHYRLSISWPRIFPDGMGKINHGGLDFYQRLIDTCHKFNITPAVTCFHWDMPSWLQKQGGWQARDTAFAFADYCAVLSSHLSDGVTTWYTLNEPTVFWKLGHETGIHAPGLKLDRKASHQVSHHFLLAHGLAVQAIREASDHQTRVGIVENLYSYEPLQVSPDDIHAARRQFQKMNAWILDPIFHGRYPPEDLDILGQDAPVIAEGDMANIAQPLDCFGVNHYSPMAIVSGEHGVRNHESWYPRTDFGWPISRESLYWTLRFFTEIWAPSCIEVTENGCCYPDEPGVDGAVHDYARIEYLKGMMASLDRALSEGCPVEAYYLWSFLDNFEWAEGYTKRFGLVHVNYENFKRTPKESARWYRRLISEKRKE